MKHLFTFFSRPHPPRPRTHGGPPSRQASACPRCRELSLVRKRASSSLAQLRKRFSEKRLFDCEACGWAGWLTPLESLDRAYALSHAAPNIGAIDHELDAPAPGDTEETEETEEPARP